MTVLEWFGVFLIGFCNSHFAQNPAIAHEESSSLPVNSEPQESKAFILGPTPTYYYKIIVLWDGWLIDRCFLSPMLTFSTMEKNWTWDARRSCGWQPKIGESLRWMTPLILDVVFLKLIHSDILLCLHLECRMVQQMTSWKASSLTGLNQVLRTGMTVPHTQEPDDLWLPAVLSFILLAFNRTTFPSLQNLIYFHPIAVIDR